MRTTQYTKIIQQTFWLMLLAGLFVLPACNMNTPELQATTESEPFNPILVLTPSPVILFTPSPTATFTPRPTATTTPTVAVPDTTIKSDIGQVYMRAEPSPRGTVTILLEPGTEVDLIGRTQDNRWFQVGIDQFVGWVLASAVDTQINVDTINVEGIAEVVGDVGDSIAGPNGVVEQGATGLRLRNRPNTSNSLILTNLTEGTLLTMIGRTEDGQWVQIITADNISGWINTSFVNTTLDVFTEIPVLDDEAIAQASALNANGEVIEEGDGLRVRSEPSLAGEVVGNLPQFSPVNAVGRSADSQWLLIETLFGIRGWVWADYIRLSININDLDISFGDSGIESNQIPPDETQAQFVSNPTQNSANFTGYDALIIEQGDGLRIREKPGLSQAVVGRLDAFTQLHIDGRTSDDLWVKVETDDGIIGWVWVAYLELQVDLGSIAILADSIPVPQPNPSIISGVTSHAREIYLHGQELGNRANVFSKIGDSITFTGANLSPIGLGDYSLGDYSNLQSVINYFSAVSARSSNSFSNRSLSAQNGWTAFNAIDSTSADPSVCNPGEMPIECEYRVVKPAIAIIMYGTNDLDGSNPIHFEHNISRIVEISIERGVIPVLSTIPHRVNYGTQVAQYNTIIKTVAQTYDIPLIDLWLALNNLPQQGLSNDGIHLSVPPAGANGAANFEGDFLQRGVVVRNLVTVQMLDAIWQGAMY